MVLSKPRGFLLAIAFALVFMGDTSHGQDAPLPARDAGAEPNIFYGANNPVARPTSSVLVFVHGLGGSATDWWTRSDMYQVAYDAGYRTAYVSLNADNSPNNATIAENSAMLKILLPRIAQRFQTDQLYLIGHSKGGLDIQSALLSPVIRQLTKAVFTISTPNGGTELANWAFANPQIAAPLGLLTPAIASIRTDAVAVFRAIADPTLKASGIPFYTIAGNNFLDSAGTAITGAILRSLTNNTTNDTLSDGLVTVERSRLPATFSADLGSVATNHFRTDEGSVSFHKIHAVIQGLELTFDEFERIAADGFSELGGNPHSLWAWSMKWFKDQLYVGTGVEGNCVSLLTSDVRAGTKIYPLATMAGQCPAANVLTQVLGAEIWRYTPATKHWDRVFRSPDEVLTRDLNGNLVFTARDIGFRGMEVFVEPDGTEALYVGSVTSGSVFEPAPFVPNGYPPPRILRTVNGADWNPLPQDPGTFLGEIGNTLIDPVTKYRSFRALQSHNGKLFATVADYVGVGTVIVSANPAAGNDAWSYAGPSSRSEFPVWNLKSFNGALYATTGLTRDQDPNAPGYGVYKTTAEGAPPYTWTPIITNGGNQTRAAYRAPNGLSMQVFKGRLYVGTNRPAELVRINPNDTWDLVVGEPRFTPQGAKFPISGFGNGFGNWFNGHFWRMAAWGDYLYLTTWDWSVGLQQFSFLPNLDRMFGMNYGFNIYRSSDGVRWTAVTHSGLGDPNNSGGRSIEATPAGLFLGTARQRGGLQVFRTDGPPPPPAHLPPPTNLSAASELIVGRNVLLNWDPSPGAVEYHVYRALVMPATELLAQPVSVPTANGGAVTTTYSDLLSGSAAAELCGAQGLGDSAVCAAVAQIQQQAAVVIQAAPLVPAAFPLPYRVIARRTTNAFFEPAPSNMQSLYFVRAMDAAGNLSAPSNLVGGPSKGISLGAPPIALCRPAIVTCTDGNACGTTASIDGGTFDPNNEPLSIAQTPAGPYGAGITTVQLTASNRYTSRSCSATVTVIDQQPPVIAPIAPLSLATAPGVCSATAPLTPPVATDNLAIATLVNDAPAVFPLGTTLVTWTATDTSKNSTTATQIVQVRDTEAPTISAVRADRTVLWPPNGKLVPVNVTYTLTDNCTATTNLTRQLLVTSAEQYDRGFGGSRAAPAPHDRKANDARWSIVTPLQVLLQAAWDPHGWGRSYTIAVNAIDAAGNRATGSVAVEVPKAAEAAVAKQPAATQAPVAKVQPPVKPAAAMPSAKDRQ
jgi:pimeloyl-ACP methyl ester carboxylesterase